MISAAAPTADEGDVDEWTRDLRFSAPRQTLVLGAAALATVLTACVGAVDRLTDVASTVQGPLAVRKARSSRDCSTSPR